MKGYADRMIDDARRRGLVVPVVPRGRFTSKGIKVVHSIPQDLHWDSEHFVRLSVCSEILAAYVLKYKLTFFNITGPGSMMMMMMMMCRHQAPSTYRQFFPFG
jgi:hypothetical protein